MFSITTPFPGTRLWDELVKKNPDLEFDQRFARAYYYNDYTEEIIPFFNVSEVPDEKLARMAIIAEESFELGKHRRRYIKYFGKRLGTAVWRLSRVWFIQMIGRGLLNLGLFAGFRKLGEEQLRPWA
jgi:hypothetical protein